MLHVIERSICTQCYLVASPLLTVGLLAAIGQKRQSDAVLSVTTPGGLTLGSAQNFFTMYIIKT